MSHRHERSLKGKLLVTLMSVMLGGWLFWFGCQYLQVSRQQSGHWDGSLREVGQQILLSMPSDVDAVEGSRRLTLPGDLQAEPNTKFDKIRFQVWSLQRRASIVSSKGAPAEPLQPAFRDGLATTRAAGEDWRVYAITDASGRVQVQVGMARSQLQAELGYWLKVSLLSALALLFALALAIWAAIQWSLRPVNRLRDQMAQREAMDLAPLSTRDIPREIKPLLASFNDLLARLSQAMQGERQFLADAAHELRTPLAALLTQTQVALRAGSQADAREALVQLSQGIERTSRLAQQLLDSARIDASQRGQEHAVVELADVISLVAREFEGMAARRQQTISLDTGLASVRGDLDDLGVLVRNLIDNAVRYSGEQGHIRVHCARRADGGVEMTVSDNGPGVPLDERERIFERFFRGSTGNGERGSGIGLSLVQRIARAHGATLSVEDGRDACGLCVRVVFPAA
ncbi:sensor histidine kinase [Pseudoxanthomonas indica]|uniref:histidine kinase n=1 Tax=Pseudoxanthomonas indica TaxID=428993 RepID=A0A1T5KUN8_9GAMM|nr:ATP-binding protein [Pseudoxanthomonas indica]SKC67175.1 Signal transduction histidine kinase [Pseudoxanthomonas indica]